MRAIKRGYQSEIADHSGDCWNRKTRSWTASHKRRKEKGQEKRERGGGNRWRGWGGENGRGGKVRDVERESAGGRQKGQEEEERQREP